MKIQKVITYAALTAVCLLLVIPIIVYAFPILAGADGSYTVMSGSMSPALSPGDLVIVKGEEPIDIGDVVTVESKEFTYTHRVVERLNDGRFRLKGDANEDPDPGLIEASQIIGKVVLVFPFGHLYTPYGFASALLVPAALIIGKQMHTIHQHTKRRNRRETMRWRRKNHSALDTGTVLLALILMVSTTRIIAPHFIAGSSSYFSDVEWGNSFLQTGTWVFPSEIECRVSPSSIKLGKFTTIHVNLKPPHSAEVTIEISTDGELWNELTKLTSTPGGACTYKWTPEEIGSYTIKASWEGDDSHYGASSETVTLSVEST